MPSAPDIKYQIADVLKAFATRPLYDAGLGLLDTLGYRSELTLKLKGIKDFQETMDQRGRLNEKAARVDDWKQVEFLRQISGDDISATNQTALPLHSKAAFESSFFKSYVFLALELKNNHYTRTDLAQIARAVNRVFDMPAMILFKHGSALTLAIINRRLHKRDDSKDVLEKVTLIRDIQISNPHRAHIEILFDLTIDELRHNHPFSNFDELHFAWQKTLDTKELNKRFFQDLANWYFWALENVEFPDDIEKKKDIRNATNLIRLITRVVFIWFIKEKNLVPDALFNKNHLSKILPDLNKAMKSDTYYRAILQNLFFGTLNQKMGERAFAKEGTFAENKSEYGVKNLFRYADSFSIKEKEIVDLFRDIPFLNGGLFDCLDKPNDDGKIIYVDGFSRNPKKQAKVPDYLFFSEEQKLDLNEVFGTKNKKYEAKGLINLLNSYKFTIAENTPIEEEIALDPELLGKVFENLLASYNPETQTTARKQTGSFYTPREIVNYMVDESLLAYLKQELEKLGTDDADAKLRELLSYSENPNPFSKKETKALIAAIDDCNILDPACGSGAFPMGILHKMVHILHKLDPRNELWKQKQIEKATQIDDPNIREHAIQDIEAAFENNELDYGRKLYLIENCIYGVDIQPIAVQIAKLRFFISLIIDENKQPGKENFGLRSLPNLETKFVAANTLIGIDSPEQGAFKNPEITKLENDLKQLRHAYFNAKTRKEKLSCQKKDKEYRQQIAQLLIADGWKKGTAQQVVKFDPYDQNASADFFDPEWMFGLQDGFHITISNPPWVRHEAISDQKPALKENFKDFFCGTADLSTYFYKRGLDVLKPGGHLCFIGPNKFMRAGYGKNTRTFLATEVTPKIVIDFGDLPIFEATTYPSILLVEKRKPQAETKTHVASFTENDQIERLDETLAAIAFDMPLKSLKPEGWNLEQPKIHALMNKLRAAGTPLGKYVNGNIYRGVLTGLNEAFVIDNETRKRLIAEDSKSNELIRPWLRGRDIRKWKAEWAGLYLISIPSSANQKWPWSSESSEPKAQKIFQRTYPAVYKHLSQLIDQLRKRDDQGKFWWELRSCAYYEEFEKPKIMYAEIATNGLFLLDQENYYSDTTTYIIADSSEYLLALLNSKLCTYIFSKISAVVSGGYLRWKRQYMEHPLCQY